MQDNDERQQSIGSFFRDKTQAVYGKDHPKQLRKTNSLVFNLVVSCSVPMSMCSK